MKTLRIDSQILTSLSHCPLRCKYTFIERLIPKTENPAFAMGSAVHIAHEVYYNLLKKREPFLTRVEQALLTATNWMVTKSELDQEQQATVLRTLKEYYSYRQSDRIEVKEVEVFFTKQLYEGDDLVGDPIEVLYEGKIDLIADLDGILQNFDHKSTSRNFEPVDFTNQFLGYKWATGLDVTVNRIGFQSSLKPEAKFRRFPFRYQKEAVTAWEQHAVRKSLEYAYYLEHGEFPPNFGACEGKFGYPCNYINMCRYPSLIDDTKKFEFKVGEVWDPSKEKNT